MGDGEVLPVPLNLVRAPRAFLEWVFNCCEDTDPGALEPPIMDQDPYSEEPPAPVAPVSPDVNGSQVRHAI